MAAALVATAFLATTMQARIDSNQDLNKDSYLRAIADRIITSTGKPADWGKNEGLPVEFGLASNVATNAYELDIDKVNRLSKLHNDSLSHLELAATTKLNNIAFAIEAVQIMSINLELVNNYTSNSLIYSILKVATSIESKPSEAHLTCYLIGQNYQYNHTAEISKSGSTEIGINYPVTVDDPLFVVFARSIFDERITSYSIFNLEDGSQESIPSNTKLSLSPHNYFLNYNISLADSIQKIYAISYSHQHSVASVQGGQSAFPNLIDTSPTVLVVCGLIQDQYFQEWVSYPQIPLTIGSSFSNSDRNIFPYLVTVDGVLYKLNLSLGDANP